MRGGLLSKSAIKLGRWRGVIFDLGFYEIVHNVNGEITKSEYFIYWGRGSGGGRGKKKENKLINVSYNIDKKM